MKIIKYFKKNSFIQTTSLAVFGFMSIWTILHLPGIFYGTQNVPLHVSYYSSDEQSPINGALHIMKDRSLLGLRNQHTLYYGPVFALIAVPAVGVDYVNKSISGEVRGAESYKNSIIWDWGGILRFARLIAVGAGALGVIAVFLLFNTSTLNPSQNKIIPFIVSVLMASNFMYFEYSTFFRHWIFIIVFLLWEIYFVIKILENQNRINNFLYWFGAFILIIASYGVSFLSIIYQIFWAPILLYWLVNKEHGQLKKFVVFSVALAIGFITITAWHPYAFSRVLGLVGGDLTGSAELQSQTTIVQTGYSFWFYIKTLFVNLLGITLSLSALLFILKKKISAFIKHWCVIAVFIFPALVHFIIFGFISHHETRYILPTLILSILLFGFIYSLVLGNEMINASKKKIINGILVVGVIISMLQIVGWQKVMFDGPIERQTIIPQIHSWQAENEHSRTLLLKNWPLGYVHSQSAYSSFYEKYDKSQYEMWRQIIILPLPNNLAPLNVYYERSKEDAYDSIGNFEHFVVHHPPVVGEDIAWESPMDEFDIRPWHLINYKDYLGHFEIIK